jgi:hypothetical protein
MLGESDMGGALSAVKDALQETGDGGELVRSGHEP